MNIYKYLLSILIITSLLSACGGAESKKEKYLKRGDSYFLDGNYEKARLEYKNSLQITPDDVQARYALAQTLEKLNFPRQAAGNFLKVIQLDPKHVEAHINIARYYLNARVFERAQKVIDEALSLQPNNASAIALRGTLRSVKGEKQLAMKDAIKALEIEPSNLDATALKTGLYVASKDNDKAIETLDKGIKLNPDNSELRLLIAGIYANQGQNGRAIEVLQKVITLNPQRLQYRLQLSRFYDANKATNEALRVLKAAVDDLKDKQNAILSLTDYIAKRASKNKAEIELKSYITKYPELYELQLGLGRLYQGQNLFEQAIELYENIIDHENNKKYGLISKTQLAQIYIKENLVDKAQLKIDEVLKENPQDTLSLIMRGSIALSKNKLIDAIGDFRSVLRNQPNHPVTTRLLAKAHIANNEPELAKKQYIQAINVSPRNINLKIELAKLFIATGDIVRAAQVLKNANIIDPQNMATLGLLYKTYMSLGKTKLALNISEEIKRNDKENPSGFYAAGVAFGAQKNYTQAHNEFTQGLSLAKGSVKLITAITNNYIKQNKHSQAVKFLSKQITLSPKSVSSRNLLGEVYLSQKKLKLAKKYFISAENLKPDWNVPYQNLASIYLMQKNIDSAIAVFKRGKKANTNNQVLSYSLANLYAQLGKSDLAIKEFEEILSLNPESYTATNNLAMMLISFRNDKESINKAVSLVDKFKESNNPNYLDTLGWVLVKGDKPNLAIDYLKKAAKKLPDSGLIQYHLGKALFNSGDTLKAKHALQQAVKSTNKFKGKTDAEFILNKIATQKS